MAEGSNKIGRPSSYTYEVAAELCGYLSMGESLRKACGRDGMPVPATVFKWMREHEEFLKQYTRAKEEAADALAEEILDISDEDGRDAFEGEDGRLYPNNARIQRDRLRVESRKWLMAKMKPKRYGDKLDVTSGGDKLPAPIFGGTSVAQKKEDD